MKEIWKEIKNYEGKYWISDLGRVKNSSEIIMKPCKTHDGYARISLRSFENKRKNHPIHRLVAWHFLKLIDGKNQVNHIDGNKLNNVLSNLEWCNCKENYKHSLEIGLRNYKTMYRAKGERKSTSKLKEIDVFEIKKIRSCTNLTMKEIGVIFNVSDSVISNILNNKAWTYLNDAK